MKTLTCLFALIAALSVLVSAQQLAPAGSAPALQTLTQIDDNSVSILERAVVGAADAMPESKYSFVPTNGEFKGVRTFASSVKHVAVTNYFMAAAILRENPPVDLSSANPVNSITSKADIVKYLQGSFSYLHKAVASINEKNATEQVPNPEGAGTVPKLDIAIRQMIHNMDHYGQMVVYLRMNGIVPPESRHQQ
jgi:hypothetical protein